MKMTREEFRKEVTSAVDSALAEKIEQGAAAGDKLEKDHGVAAVFQKMFEHMEEKKQAVIGQAEKAARIGRVMRCLANAKSNKGTAEDMAKAYGDNAVLKTIQMSDFTSGGALLEPGFFQEVTEFLRARTVVRRLGARSIGLVNGTMSIPFISQGAAASYVSEGSAPNATTLEFGQLNLTGRKIVALVPISNDWLRSEGGGSMGGAEMVGQDLARAVSVTEDAAFIRGDGTLGSPKGLRNWAIAGNQVAQSKAGGTVTVAEAGYDLVRLQYLVRAQNVEIFNGAYLMSPRSWLSLMSGRDANSNLIWAPEMATGTLLGQQFDDTTSIPDNLGGGSESEIIFASMDTCVIAEDENLLADMFDGASYVDSAGNVSSGVSQDESVMRVISKHDFGCRHRGREVSVLTGVDWEQLA